MGIEDLSLDEIIKRGNSEMYSDKLPGQRNQSFQSRKRPARGGGAGRGRIIQAGTIQDARLLITTRSKAKIGDARQKISAKRVVDARQKIRAKRKLNSTADKSGGKIPKVTISNDRARKPLYHGSSIQFHITAGSNSRSGLERKFPTVSRRNTGSGIQIAVRNERARKASPKPTQKTFERLQITTINREAMKKKPSTRRRDSVSPRPSRPISKRAMEVDSDSDYEEYRKYRKQRRRQTIDDVEEMEVTEKSDPIDLRPMISKQAEKAMDQNPASVGPSPIEGTKLKVFNLHPVVSEDDILELFSVIGPVRRARLVRPGEAEVVYIRHENAMAAYKKYNSRDLDGQPMQIKVLKASEEKPKALYSWMKDIKTTKKRSDVADVTELHSGVLQQALFKGGSTGTSTRPVVFTVKI